MEKNIKDYQSFHAEACKATLEKAAGNAEGFHGAGYNNVIKSSITSESNIVIIK